MYSFRRSVNHAAAFSAFVRQDLHMLGGRSGVDMQTLDDEFIAPVLQVLRALFAFALVPSVNHLVSMNMPMLAPSHTRLPVSVTSPFIEVCA